MSVVDMAPDPLLDAVTVRPGDTLIVRVRSDISHQQFEDFTDTVKDRLPGIKLVFMNAEQLLVYRPNGDEG